MPKEHNDRKQLNHLRRQLEQWEQDGYDVSELKTRWHEELFERESIDKPIIYCSQCGKQVSITSKFCKACGFEIDSEKIEKAQTLETETHPAANEKPSAISAQKIFSGKSKLGLGSLLVSLIFGFITIVFVFLPWSVIYDVYDSRWLTFSGWDVRNYGSGLFTVGSYDLYYGVHVVLNSSAIMAAFAFLAIVTHKKQRIQRIFVKIALLAAIIALGASIFSEYIVIFSEYVVVNVNEYWPVYSKYGPIGAIVCCSIGFLTLLIADWKLWRYQRSVRKIVE